MKVIVFTSLQDFARNESQAVSAFDSKKSLKIELIITKVTDKIFQFSRQTW